MKSCTTKNLTLSTRTGCENFLLMGAKNEVVNYLCLANIKNKISKTTVLTKMPHTQHKDEVKFYLLISDTTGAFLNCDMRDTNIRKFYQCMFYQDDDDDQDFDAKGRLKKRGIGRLRTVPMHQWGERCLNISFRASASFTLSVWGEIFDEGKMSWFRERVYPKTEQE